jgi:hypothetical protein
MKTSHTFQLNQIYIKNNLWSTAVYLFVFLCVNHVNLSYCKNEKRDFWRVEPCSILLSSNANEERNLVIVFEEGEIKSDSWLCVDLQIAAI